MAETFLEFDSKAGAEARSRALAVAKGCRSDPANGTLFWFRVEKAEGDTEKSVMVIPDGRDGDLTSEERGKLQDRSKLEAWKKANLPSRYEDSSKDSGSGGSGGDNLLRERRRLR